MAARARLFMASPIFNADQIIRGERWKQATEACLAALQAADKAGYGTSVKDIESWDRAFYGFNGSLIRNPLLRF